MADLLKQVRDKYDMVIIDAPPLLPVTDAALLASCLTVHCWSSATAGRRETSWAKPWSASDR